MHDYFYQQGENARLFSTNDAKGFGGNCRFAHFGAFQKGGTLDALFTPQESRARIQHLPELHAEPFQVSTKLTCKWEHKSPLFQTSITQGKGRKGAKHPFFLPLFCSLCLPQLHVACVVTHYVYIYSPLMHAMIIILKDAPLRICMQCTACVVLPRCIQMHY